MHTGGGVRGRARMCMDGWMARVKCGPRRKVEGACKRAGN